MVCGSGVVVNVWVVVVNVWVAVNAWGGECVGGECVGVVNMWGW